MKVKELKDYSDRELLELLVSNQVRMEQRLYKIYWYLSGKDSEDFQKHNIHKGEVFNEFIKSLDDLNMQIGEFIPQDKD